MSQGDSNVLPAAILDIVPTGKSIVWILGIISVSAATGFGFAFRVGDTAEHIEAIPAIQTSVETNTERIEELETRFSRESEETQAALRRIRCLAALSATGQVVDPLRIDDVCP